LRAAANNRSSAVNSHRIAQPATRQPTTPTPRRGLKTALSQTRFLFQNKPDFFLQAAVMHLRLAAKHTIHLVWHGPDDRDSQSISVSERSQ